MKESHHEIHAEARPLAATPAFARSGAPALTLDFEKYRKFLAGAGLTEAQERQLIEAHWEVIVAFVSMGFNIHPVQQAIAEESTLVSDSPSMVGCGSNSEINNEEKDAGRGDVRTVQGTDS